MNDRTIGNGNQINGNSQNGDNQKNRYDHEWRIASFNRTLTFSTEAGKAVIYINGGAAVSMLTFCGRYIGNINFWSILSMGVFGIGSFLGAAALLIAYAAQDHFTHHDDHTGNKYNACCLAVGILSGVLFLLGLLFGALAIWTFNGRG